MFTALINSAIEFLSALMEAQIHSSALGISDSHWIVYRSLRNEIGEIYYSNIEPRIACPFPTLPLHFAFLSRSSIGMVCLYENNKGYRKGVHSKMKIGKYLAKYFPELSNQQIIQYVNDAKLLQDIYTLEFRNDIAQAYQDSGIDSCMGYSDTNYDSHCHPMEFFEGGNFQCALLLDDDNNCKARALVNNDLKVYPMIYGDSGLMKQYLDKAGYKHGSFNGLSLPAMWEDEGRCLVMPYIDGFRPLDRSGACSMEFDLMGETIVLRDSCGQYSASDTNGITLIDYTRCEHCNDPIDTEYDSYYYTHDDEIICEHCTDNYYISTQNAYGDYRLTSINENYIITEDGEAFTDDSAANHQGYYECPIKEIWLHESEMVWCALEQAYLSQTAADDKACLTDGNGENFYVDFGCAVDQGRFYISANKSYLTLDRQGNQSFYDYLKTHSITEFKAELGEIVANMNDEYYQEIIEEYNEYQIELEFVA